MAENLTTSTKLVIRTEELVPKKGYTVHIMNETKAGPVFIEILEPDPNNPKSNKAYKPPIFAGPSNYFAFAVSCEEAIEYDFNVPVFLADNIHDVVVNVTIYYHVIDFLHVINGVAKDPLQRLIDEVKRRVNEYMHEIQWDKFVNDKSSVKTGLVSREFIGSINKHSSKFGLEIKDLGIVFSIPDRWLKVEIVRVESETTRQIEDIKRSDEKRTRIHERQKKEEEFDHASYMGEKERELQLIEKEHESKLKAIERKDRFYDGIAEQSIQAIGNVANETRTTQVLRDGMRVLMGMQSDFIMDKKNQESASYRSQLTADKMLQLPDLGFDSILGDDLLTLVQTVIPAIMKYDCSDKEKKDLISILLHLHAELIKEVPFPKEVMEYSRKLRNYIEEDGKVYCDILKEHYVRLRNKIPSDIKTL
jgi:hypothetical protein